MPRIHLGVCLVCLLILLAGCNGSAPPTPVPRPPASPDVPNSTGAPTQAEAGKADEVFLQLLSIYQTRGFDAAVQFARDQALINKQDEVRITLVLDSEDPSVVDSTALAVERLGGRVSATVANIIEVAVPVQRLLDYGQQTNKQSFVADLSDFQHVKDIRRTPTANPVI